MAEVRALVLRLLVVLVVLLVPHAARAGLRADATPALATSTPVDLEDSRPGQKSIDANCIYWVAAPKLALHLEKSAFGYDLASDLGLYRYTAFGKTYAPTGTTPTPSVDQPMRWKGRWVDPVTGLYDVRTRQWAPQIGVFIQMDENRFFRPNGTLWSWPMLNPIRFRDPYGRDAWEAILGVGVPAGVGALLGYALFQVPGAVVGGLAGGGVGLGLYLSYGDRGMRSHSVLVPLPTFVRMPANDTTRWGSQKQTVSDLCAEHARAVFETCLEEETGGNRCPSPEDEAICAQQAERARQECEHNNAPDTANP